MTGRELVATAKPLEAFAASVTHFLSVGHQAIRLEEGLAAQSTRLTALQAEVTTAVATLADLQKEAKALQATLDAERQAAVTAWQAEADAKAAEVAASLARQQKLVESWTTQAKAAEAEFATRQAALVEQETALKARVDALRAQAKDLLRAAEAVIQ
jgi:phage host-nuclease inhibitor protein Gam